MSLLYLETNLGFMKNFLSAYVEPPLYVIYLLVSSSSVQTLCNASFSITKHKLFEKKKKKKSLHCIQLICGKLKMNNNRFNVM